MSNEYFAEKALVKQGAVPQDLNGNAVTGARFDMSNSDRLAIVISFGDSTGAAVGVTLQQHDAATSGNSKNLEISNTYYHKAGAATSFTAVDPSSDTAVYDLASVFAAEEGLVIFEVLSEDLDVNANFSHVSVNLADSTAAKIAAIEYIGHFPYKKPAYEVEA